MSDAFENWMATTDIPVAFVKFVKAGWQASAAASAELMKCGHPKACWQSFRVIEDGTDIGEQWGCSVCAELAQSAERIRQLEEKVAQQQESCLHAMNRAEKWSNRCEELLAERERVMALMAEFRGSVYLYADGDRLVDKIESAFGGPKNE